MADIKIDTGSVKSISRSLSLHGQEILNQYRQDCSYALNLGKECLMVSGLNVDEFFNALERIYVNLNEKIQALANFLGQNVSMGYDEVSQILANNFNNKLGTELSTLLGMSVVSGGVTPRIKPLPSNMPIDYEPTNDGTDNREWEPIKFPGIPKSPYEEPMKGSSGHLRPKPINLADQLENLDVRQAKRFPGIPKRPNDGSTERL